MELSTLSVSRGLTTVTSIAVSLPPVQLGIRTSAGLALVSGRRAFSSFLGARLEDADDSTNVEVDSEKDFMPP